MKLYFSPTSPYVRKIRVLAIETGLAGRIELIQTNPWQKDEALWADNPLSKVPTLITDDGMVLYDSPVIIEYLDGLHDGPPRLPATGQARWRCLRLQALADGILDAAVLRFLEHKRPPEQFSADWDQTQQDAVRRALDWLDAQVGNWDESFDAGQISVACALGYLDFRFGGEPWRPACPVLADWYAQCSQRESLLQTVPVAPAG